MSASPPDATTMRFQDDEYLFLQLTIEEQQLLIPKLVGIVGREAFTAEEIRQAATRFQLLIEVETQTFRIEDKFLTLQNFTRQLGAIPAAWEQVNRFIGIATSYLEMTVHNHHLFLAALQAEGYAVNSWMEKVSRWIGYHHRFDSARACTEHRFEPQLHLVNDRADEAAYGPHYFFVHWDAQSVFAKRGSLFSRIAAGRTHKHQSASPQLVKAYLDGRKDRGGEGEKNQSTKTNDQ